MTGRQRHASKSQCAAHNEKVPARGGRGGGALVKRMRDAGSRGFDDKTQTANGWRIAKLTAQMNYLRSQQPTSPSNMPNGSSHPLSATGSAAPPGGGSVAGTSATGAGAGASGAEQWARHSPVTATHPTQAQQQQQQQQQRPAEPIVRPAQQILQSPVDKWGLKALLYEITTQMGKTDRGMLMFGEELAELGLDMMPEE